MNITPRKFRYRFWSWRGTLVMLIVLLLAILITVRVGPRDPWVDVIFTGTALISPCLLIYLLMRPSFASVEITDSGVKVLDPFKRARAINWDQIEFVEKRATGFFADYNLAVHTAEGEVVIDSDLADFRHLEERLYHCLQLEEYAHSDT